MFSHACVGIRDLDAALPFYTAVMDALGFVLRFHEPEKFWAAWNAPDAPRPLFFIGKPYNGEPATPGNGQMVAFLAPSRDAVDRAHAAALAHGGTCMGAPGLRPSYHPNYYGAYFLDLDGNKICVCCHD
jgi:catechol 2,3-dioxygenase-like lactoylglutathione lyase family enzyme